ncbi:uncharacterized protein TM35_000342490 [Trypanosoma theileri]|uniref:Rab3-GAP regulatory subunit N-terminal domain-containing protein n=1 Tax=Trypanosoma theileri TaxID=67003 RepID=A0A1X0NLT2_9TRYP|nr:uncharacterized protein TM35_000342490 [Trypanosoma theileri]ORC85637.1 hypothetical protein TM35_000342490 [Trypanosoma theileri]
MASISLHDVGRLRQTEAVSKLSRLSPTYLMLSSGVFLIASVNTDSNRCILELLVDDDATNNNNTTTTTTTTNMIGNNSSSSSSSNANSTVNANGVSSTSSMTAGEKKRLDFLRTLFRVPRTLEVLEDEGVITSIELVRDYRKLEGGKELTTSRKRTLESLYVHLFIGTSTGTVFICNALRATIMALAQFQYHGSIGRDPVETPQGNTGMSRHVNESVVRFAVHSTGPETRLNANIAQSTASMPMETLHSIYIVHSKGRVVVLDRVALDVFLTVAEERLDGKRPYFVLEWSPDSNISSFPTAGPAAHFASHVEHVFILSEIGGYSSIELQTMHSTEFIGVERCIRDAAFFFSNKGDTTAILRDGPKALESMLLCGETPALSMYTFENTRAAFSTRQTVKALVSVIGGMAKKVWRGSSETEVVIKPKHLAKKPQLAKDAFFEADLVFSMVQVDPTSQWAACYSEMAGRIYLYDLMGGAMWRVMKGCRAAEFQWHLTTIGGKRMLLLVIHLPLRHAIEVYSLRLGQRVAARHIPEGSILLRPDSSSLSSSYFSVLLLTPTRHVMQLRVGLNNNDEGVGNLVSSVSFHDSMYEPPLPSRKKREKNSPMMPCDIIKKVFNLSLPIPITDNNLFDKYYSQMKGLENNIKTHFSPGVSDDRCLPKNVRITAESIPRNLTSAQSLNFVELRLACVTNYRRALMMRSNDDETQQQQLLQQQQQQQLSLSSGSSLSSYYMMPLFSKEDGKVNGLLEQAVQVAGEAFLSDNSVSISSQLGDVLTSIQRYLKIHINSTLNEKDGKLSPIPLEEFLSFFHCCGYKLEFLRDVVREYDQHSEVTRNIWAEIGDVFFGSGRGIGCLLQQLEVFSALGFQTLDVGIVALCWLSHSFVYTPTLICNAPLLHLVFLLKTCSDAAFLSGIEQITFLTNMTPHHYKRTEASLLLMILCIIIRQLVKPIGQSYHKHCSHLLQQLLLLRTLFNQCESHITRYTSISIKHRFKKLRLGELRLSDGGGDTLNIWFFRLFDTSLASIFSENVMGNDELKKSLAGVDMVVLLKLLSIREREEEEEGKEKDLNWSQKTPWYDDGTWNHNTFKSFVIQPCLTFVDDFKRENEDGKSIHPSLTPPQLAGLSIILISCIIVLERELVPLRDKTLSFLQNNTIPDANLFEGGDISVTSSIQHPKGSRSTRDYFNSCYEVLDFIQIICHQLIGSPDNYECGKIIEIIQKLLSQDDDAVFSLIPVMIRNQLKKFMDLLSNRPEILLRRIQEARSFVKTIMFFAFTETGSRASNLSLLPSQPLSIPWDSMFEKRVIMFSLLPDYHHHHHHSSESTLGDKVMESRMKARSTLLNYMVFIDLMNSHTEKSFHLAESLSKSLGLTEFIRDMPQLILFDAAARQLFPGNELKRLLNGIKNRHLAARIAAIDFKIIITCCFRYYTNVKKNTPKENRSELQRIALKLQSMDSAMSDDCRLWIHSDNGIRRDADLSGDMEEKEKKDEVHTESLPLEYKLVACSKWYTLPLFRVVERKVWERLQLPRDSEQLVDFNENLLTLARVAAEGKPTLGSDLRRFADELPSVATRLAAVFQD